MSRSHEQHRRDRYARTHENGASSGAASASDVSAPPVPPPAAMGSLPPPPRPHYQPYVPPQQRFQQPSFGQQAPFPHQPPHAQGWQPPQSHQQQSHDPHRRPHVVPRNHPQHHSHHQHHQQPQNGHGQGHGHGHASRASDPLAIRPPPPPAERPASLLSHVLPSSRGKYAYVFLVMKGDSYARGAIIGAYSLRQAGTRHSLVCMVTPDVSAECRRRMLYVFTEVVEVPYLQYEVKPLRTQKQRSMYNSWVDAAFTKWNMLNLTQYEKTLFVDADKIALHHMDHLFEEMATPAGTFSSPWSQPFVERKDAIARKKTGTSSQRGHYHNKKGMHNPYQHNEHNTRVTSAQVYSGLTEQSFVVIGTVVLLSPNREDFEQYKAMLATLVPFGFEDSHSMMDEQSLSYYFAIYKNRLIQNGAYGKLTANTTDNGAAASAASPASAPLSSSSDLPASSVAVSLPANAYSEWSFIGIPYNYVPWHRYWLKEDEVPYVFHFFNVKPWDEARNKWPDLEAWWELVLALAKDSSLSEEARADLLTIFPSNELNQAKVQGCAWCRFSEDALMMPPTEAYKQHNAFDSDGRLECPAMRTGFAREEAQRAAAKASAAANDTKEATATASAETTATEAGTASATAHQ